MLQLSLPLQITDQPSTYKEEDFCLLPQNIDAYNFLKKFLNQKDQASSQFSAMILKGEEGSGKTHMLKVLAKEFSIEFLKKEEIIDLNFNNIFEKNKFYALENIEEIADENFLFHLINFAFETGSFLILSSNFKANFQLKDLASRLKNIYLAEIKNPDLDAIKLLLVNLFSRKQIKLSSAIINYIANNINREYLSILGVVKKIDFYIQENSVSLTLKQVKLML